MNVILNIYFRKTLSYYEKMLKNLNIQKYLLNQKLNDGKKIIKNILFFFFQIFLKWKNKITYSNNYSKNPQLNLIY